jgi:fluoride exporter
MPNLLLVMAGGAIGAGFRFQLGRLALHQFGPGFPWGTLIVNLLGGLLIGVLAGRLARFGEAGESLRLFLSMGILGGFTTFSAFSLETMNMLHRGEVGFAAAYVTASVAGSVLLLMTGLWLVRAAS